MRPLAVNASAPPFTAAAPAREQGGRRRWFVRQRAMIVALLLAAPALAYLTAFYLAPMALLLLQSVAGGSLGHYEKALTDALYLLVLRDTLLIAAYVTVDGD